jgi:hypothetical protein
VLDLCRLQGMLRKKLHLLIRISIIIAAYNREITALKKSRLNQNLNYYLITKLRALIKPIINIITITYQHFPIARVLSSGIATRSACQFHFVEKGLQVLFLRQQQYHKLVNMYYS